MTETTFDGTAGDDRPDFGLTDDEGNAALARLLDDVAVQVERGEVERSEALVLLGDGVQELATQHPEVADITVRTAIVEALDPAFTRQGWQRLEPFEF